MFKSKLTAGLLVTALATSLIGSIPALASVASGLPTYDAAQGQLDFSEGKLNGAGSLVDQNTSGNLGTAAAVGTYIDYYNVKTIGSTQIDARLTFSAQSGMESGSGFADGKVEVLDQYSTDVSRPNERINNQFYADAGFGDEWMEYKIEFFTGLATTPIPVTLENVVLSIYDIDWYQYIEAEGFAAYYFSTSTILSASAKSGGYTRFSETAGIGSSTGDESRVELEYASASVVTLRLGQEPPVSGLQGGGSFSLDFSALNAWGTGARAAAATPPVFSSTPAPYTGPLLSGFSSRTLDPCKPTSITITGSRLSDAVPTIQGKAVKVLEQTENKLVLEFPEGLTPGNNVDLVVTSSAGALTHQDAFDIPAGVCAAEISKGRWTQIQSDGTTVKIYAKDPVGDGKIQFFVDGKELAWINAIDESDPKLFSASSGYPYLVRSVTLHEGKNRFEIKLDGVRVWRATYVPKS